MEASLSDLYSNVTDQLDERAHSSENSGANSPSSTNFTSILSSPKISRRAIKKKVVTIPLKDLEGSRFKGDCTPPSDSWAWRKYGQKPIKGSPYPRGYYRCSSSKGCPARKQVERSRSDPNMLLITYSYEHNHPWPTSRNHQNRHNSTSTTTAKAVALLNSPSCGATISTTTTNNNNHKVITPVENNYCNNNNNQTILYQQNNINNMDHYNQPLMAPTDELSWLSSDHDILQNSFFNNSNFTDLDMTKFFPIREEDESLFADLGELPECAIVSRRAAAAVEAEEKQQCKLTPWCGTMG